MEKEQNTPKTNREIDDIFKPVFKKIQEKVKETLLLNDSNMEMAMRKHSHSHEYFITLMVEERRILKDLKDRQEKMLHDLKIHFRSPKAKIQAKNLNEAEVMARKDSRYKSFAYQVLWREKIVEYLEEINKLFRNQTYTFGNLVEYYKLDPTNIVPGKKDE